MNYILQEKDLAFAEFNAHGFSMQQGAGNKTWRVVGVWVLIILILLE